MTLEGHRDRLRPEVLARRPDAQRLFDGAVNATTSPCGIRTGGNRTVSGRADGPGPGKPGARLNGSARRSSLTSTRVRTPRLLPAAMLSPRWSAAGVRSRGQGPERVRDALPQSCRQHDRDPGTKGRALRPRRRPRL